MIYRAALFGGIYSNYLALDEAIGHARAAGVDEIFCLGDLGAFGPHPNRTCEILRENDIRCIQGNYDNSIGNELDDCQCGYTDPRDNHFAQISYDYTLANTASENRRWMKGLPAELRLDIAGCRVLLCHGSPRKTNEFLWESTTSDAFLDYLLREYQADHIFCTHTGIKWHQPRPDNRHVVNVGVLGRPENDGRTNVWYALAEWRDGNLSVEFVPIEYDNERLADEMKQENLPAEFIETIRTGWWTTCLEVLPAKERRRGKW